MNKKGFALTETLVVVVFLVSIFTFIYVSIIPLIGKYESVVNNDQDIDVIYKLYHIRKVIMSGEYRTNLTSGQVKRMACSDLYSTKGEDYRSFCNKLMEQLELRSDGVDNYVLIYAESITNTNLNSIRSINSEIADYVVKYRSKITRRTLFLLDTKKHTIGHLYYDDAV